MTTIEWYNAALIILGIALGLLILIKITNKLMNRK